MTAAQTAIVELISSKEFKKCIAKIEPAHLQDELTSEVYLALLETAPDKIEGMAERNELKFYAARIIHNMACSNTSPFYKKFRDIRVTTYNEALNDGYGVNESKELNPRNEYYEDVYYSKINIDNLFDENEIRDRKKLELLAFSLIDQLYWYDAQILKLYLYYGDYRTTAINTRIPFPSIYCTVQKAAKELKALVDAREIPTDLEIGELLNKIESILQVDNITD